mgnify:CR=1 FL=1
MKEELDFEKAPYQYALCLNRECPKASNCFRQLLENVAPADLEYWRIVSPKYQANLTGDCPFYRPYGKMRYARGFITALNSLTYPAMHSVVFQLMSHFGRRTYYRMRKGERLLSRNEQQYIQAVFKKFGGIEPIQFDAYEEDLDW